MTYEIQAGKHSADKDHRVMTGGTLTLDKTVHCEAGVSFYTYSIPLYIDSIFDTDFHRGVHTTEHMIAYKKDTGSVRNSLEEVTDGTLSGKVILDISPYKTGAKSFGFRITSMVALEIHTVKKLMDISLKRALEFLEAGVPEDTNDFQAIPFARPESCGQFDFHNTQRAIEDIKQATKLDFEIQEKEFSSQHSKAYVCDLRFLKPKVEGGDDMILFSPDFSYLISELIETYLPQEIPGTITIVGTFGCMTGMYLCVSSTSGDSHDIPAIHASIIKILNQHIERNNLSQAEIIQFDTLLENYNIHAQKL